MADRFTVFVRDDKRCLDVKPPTRLVLYALASRVDSKGYCFPSVEQLIKDTGLSRATIFRALADVREILTVDAPGFKHSNSYIFPYQDELGGVHKSHNFVDNKSQCETTVSQRDSDSLRVRPRPSQSETPDRLRVRPEEYNEDKQEVSLSLTLSKSGDQSQCETTGVGNYDGTSRPRTKAHIEKIKKWCKLANLDEMHTTDFIRINRLAHWSKVSGETTVIDLIADFAFKWQKDDPEGYQYHFREVRGLNAPGAR